MKMYRGGFVFLGKRYKNVNVLLINNGWRLLVIGYLSDLLI